MIEFSRDNLALMMEAGYIYVGMQKFKEAKELFEGVIVLAPDSEVPVVALGNVEFCDGKLKKAIGLYKKALKIDPTSEYAKVYLGEALFFFGEKEEGLKCLKDVAATKTGEASNFASTLIEAIESGFTPGSTRVQR